MGTPTQVAGTPSEVPSNYSTVGYVGWSAQSDRVGATLLGGLAYKGTWATLTAYTVGDVVLYSGDTYTALQAVAGSNTTPPAVGAVWRSAGDKRGPAQVSSPTLSVPHFFR